MSRHGVDHAAPGAGKRRKAVVLSVLSAGVVATMMPLTAAEVSPIVLTAAADTTATQVAQDGDNGVKTTLASCPRLCDGNRNGQRDALLEFAVRGLPADAVNVRATLRVYAWQQFASRVRAHPAQGSAAGAGAWAQRPPIGDRRQLGKIRQVSVGSGSDCRPGGKPRDEHLRGARLASRSGTSSQAGRGT
ncbi:MULTISPECIES: hypothetical protein [unclassified Micromonospora]|uniref:hypothetical protein n=1 Tax=unclassified Micromonospora TaxID=2617518 RepID=UPI0033B6FDE2